MKENKTYRRSSRLLPLLLLLSLLLLLLLLLLLRLLSWTRNWPWRWRWRLRRPWAIGGWTGPRCSRHGLWSHKWVWGRSDRSHTLGWWWPGEMKERKSELIQVKFIREFKKRWRQWQLERNKLIMWLVERGQQIIRHAARATRISEHFFDVVCQRTTWNFQPWGFDDNASPQQQILHYLPEEL